MTNAYEIIRSPLISEKSLKEIDDKKYVFIVDKRANKTHIKQSIEELYGVKVDKINIINAKPRPRRVGKYAGYKKAFKKAIVKLTKDSAEITTFTE